MKHLNNWYLNYLNEKRQIQQNPFEEKRKILHFERIINVKVPTVLAKSSPPFGPALAQYGVNVSNFCEAFNEWTEDAEIIEDLEIPVRVFLKKEKTFEFLCKGFTLHELLLTSASWIKIESEIQTSREVFLTKRIYLQRHKKTRVGRKIRRMLRAYYFKRLARKRLKQRWLDLLDIYKIYLIQEQFLSLYSNFSKRGILKSILQHLKKGQYNIIIGSELNESKTYISKKYYWRKQY